MDKNKMKNIAAAVIAMVVVSGLIIFAYDSGKRVGASSVSSIEQAEPNAWTEAGVFETAQSGADAPAETDAQGV